jgi:hypothetical protein
VVEELVSRVLAVTLLVSGCALNRQRASAPFEGCWVDNPPTGYIVSTAANSIIGDQGAGGPRIRSLANVPLSLDSIRAHIQLVTDPAACGRAWRALERHDRTPRIAVVQIGRTYWIRLPYGIQAFDDRFHTFTAIVDL